jgi:hypothetical protein
LIVIGLDQQALDDAGARAPEVILRTQAQRDKLSHQPAWDDPDKRTQERESRRSAYPAAELSLN